MNVLIQYKNISSAQCRKPQYYFCCIIFDVNDLPNSSILLVPSIFAEDTFFFNFFLSTVTKTHYFRQLMKNWLRWTNDSAVTYSTNHAKKIQHPFSSTNVKNKQSRYRRSRFDEISRCLITWEFVLERTHEVSWK